MYKAHQHAIAVSTELNSTQPARRVLIHWQATGRTSHAGVGQLDMQRICADMTRQNQMQHHAGRGPFQPFTAKERRNMQQASAPYLHQSPCTARLGCPKT